VLTEKNIEEKKAQEPKPGKKNHAGLIRKSKVID
jgi:hypothetical protein